MISAFIMFSGVMALNSFGTKAAALGSFSSICCEFKAAPIRKSFLYASFKVGAVPEDEVAFLLLEQAVNKLTAAKIKMKILLFIFYFLNINSFRLNSCFRRTKITRSHSTKIQYQFL